MAEPRMMICIIVSTTSSAEVSVVCSGRATTSTRMRAKPAMSPVVPAAAAAVRLFSALDGSGSESAVKAGRMSKMTSTLGGIVVLVVIFTIWILAGEILPVSAPTSFFRPSENA